MAKNPTPNPETPAIKSNNSWRIPIEAIIDLKSKNLANSEIAKLLGCCPSNISQRIKDVEITKKYVNNRAMIFAYHQQKIINSITKKDIKKAGLRDKIISTGVLYDKERLESGLSTSNIAYADMIKARDSKVDELRSLDEQISQATDAKGLRVGD